MRMHAQTAMIENGFVHLPKEAAWLAEYLHELTVFPKGKHDDQVDSTAQMLDWFKRAGQEPQDWMWQMYKEAQARGPEPARPEPLWSSRTAYSGSTRRCATSAFWSFGKSSSIKLTVRVCQLPAFDVGRTSFVIGSRSALDHGFPRKKNCRRRVAQTS